VKAIRIIEVKPAGETFVPTGREVLMDVESPLFDILGVRQGIGSGALSIEKALFEQISTIVKEANEPGSGQAVSE
jgi:hypothetical protein